MNNGICHQIWCWTSLLKKSQPIFGSQVPLREKHINTWLVGELFESDGEKLGPFSPQVPTSSKDSLGSNRWQGSLNCPLPLYDRDHLYGGDQTMQIYGSVDQFLLNSALFSWVIYSDPGMILEPGFVWVVLVVKTAAQHGVPGLNRGTSQISSENYRITWWVGRVSCREIFILVLSNPIYIE